MEERRHKAARVARIQQLEQRGIECSLPEDLDWMSLPLAEIDDALMLQETQYKRKGKILKMRAGFYMLNKGLVWAATEHPGPDFLKFQSVKGFDDAVAEEIDEFDDPLEKIWDMFIGPSGEMNPFLEIAILEATMLSNYVMDKRGKSKIKATVDDKGKGAPRGQGLASTTSLMTNLVSVAANNPTLAGAIGSAVTPPPQAAAARRLPATFSNFGAPPLADDDTTEQAAEAQRLRAATRLEMQEQQRAQAQALAAAQAAHQQIQARKAAEAAATAATASNAPPPPVVDEEMDDIRRLLDDLVDRNAGGGGGGEEPEEPPVQVDVATTKPRQRRR